MWLVRCVACGSSVIDCRSVAICHIHHGKCCGLKLNRLLTIYTSASTSASTSLHTPQYSINMGKKRARDDLDFLSLGAKSGKKAKENKEIRAQLAGTVQETHHAAGPAVYKVFSTPQGGLEVERSHLASSTSSPTKSPAPHSLNEALTGLESAPTNTDGAEPPPPPVSPSKKRKQVRVCCMYGDALSDSS